MAGDISNKGLGQFITIELIITLIIAGIAWGTLSTRVTALAEESVKAEQRNKERDSADKQRLRAIETEQKILTGEIGAANQKLERVEANQEHLQSDMDRVQRNLDQVLIILQGDAVNGNGNR